MKSHCFLPPIFGILRCSHLGKGSPLTLHQRLLGPVSDRRGSAAHPADECLSLLLTQTGFFDKSLPAATISFLMTKNARKFEADFSQGNNLHLKSKPTRGSSNLKSICGAESGVCIPG